MKKLLIRSNEIKLNEIKLNEIKSNKTLIVIYANCQGESIKRMLNKYYSDRFNIIHIPNFEIINNNIDISKSLLNCDIFLYQKYSNETNPKYDIDNILNNYIKKHTLKICFPTLHSCPLLFCYDVDEPNNSITISKSHPYGKFYYGISVIIDQLKKYEYKNINETKKTSIINEIFNESQKINFISDEKIKYYYDRNFDFLKKKISTSDVPEIFEFIQNNFTKVRLWHNPNHPTGILLNELVKCIFKKLNLYYDDSLENINVLNNCLNDWVMPIFPSVKKYYNITFEDICSSWYHTEIIDTKTYISKYLNELYF